MFLYFCFFILCKLDLCFCFCFCISVFLFLFFLYFCCFYSVHISIFVHLLFFYCYYYFCNVLNCFSLGIAVSPSSGSVFAASNAENLLVEFSDKGQRLRTLFVTQPIGVLLSVHLRATETLFVGENGEGATNSSIVMIDAASFSVLDHFRHPQLQHPSGMCEHNHLLLVFSQVTAQILAFNVSSKEGFVFSERILDRPEAMVSVTC